MRRFLAGALVVVALGGCRQGRAGPGDGGAAGTGREMRTVLRPGQTEVTGTVVELVADGAVAAPVPAPFTITVPVRGEGGAEVVGAVVGGRRATIAWDGGRPLPVGGDGAIDLAPARLEVSPAVVRWFVDGRPRPLTAGRYGLGAAVAVGVSGLATPSEGASFEAREGTAVVTHGGARLELAPAPLALEGPGRVELRGRLAVRTPTGSAGARQARFGEGPFRVTLTPAPGGYRVTALFQGRRLP